MKIDPRLFAGMDRKECEITVFTVHDVFADCTYVKRTLDEAKQVADNLAAGLIVEVRNNDLNNVVCRYFRNGEIWVMFQSAPGLAGRNNTKEVTPLPGSIVPLKGDATGEGYANDDF